MQDFFHDFFVVPILQGGGYNIVNTLVYAVIMLAVAFLVIFPLLNKKGVKFDFGFALALAPYIVFGSLLRVLEDLKIVERSANPLGPGFYLVTPGIYILVTVVAVTALLVSLYLGKKTKWNALSVFRNIGIVFAVPVVFVNLLYFREFLGFFAVLVIAFALTAVVIFAVNMFYKKLFEDNLNKLALFAQLLDASATFVALQFFSCMEQHVVTRALTDLAPAMFFLVKIPLVLAILYFADTQIKEENLRGFVKLLIIILGLATGTRDLFTLAVGTCS